LQIVAQGNETTCEALYEDECQNIITIPDGGSSDGSIFIGPDSSGIDSGQCNVSCFQDSDCQDSCVAPGTDTYCCDTSTDTCFVALACGDGIDSGTGVDSGFDSGGLDSGSCIDSGLACGLAPCCSGECEGDICQ
jgi:hypothetical protein